MTTLKDIFADLSYGTLKGTALGNLIADDNESEPDPKSYAQLISHINRSLRKIYGRFLLSAKEIYIQQDESIAIYELNSKYAQSNTASLEPIKYIEDSTANPFEDDVLKIEQCYDEEGNVLFLNDCTEELSLFTPSYKTIQMPYPNEFNVVAVQYRAAHPKIAWTVDVDPELVEVDIPEALYEAMLFYVAHCALPNMSGEGETMTNLQKYDGCCKEVELHGLAIQAEVGDWRFDHKGWV